LFKAKAVLSSYTQTLPLSLRASLGGEREREREREREIVCSLCVKFVCSLCVVCSKTRRVASTAQSIIEPRTVYTHSYTCTHTNGIYMRIVCVYICRCIRKLMYTRARARARTHTHTHIRTYTVIHNSEFICSIQGLGELGIEHHQTQYYARDEGH